MIRSGIMKRKNHDVKGNQGDWKMSHKKKHM